MRFGDVTAQSALDSAAIGRARAEVLTNFVDTPGSNGFPGFSTIWDKVWGIGQGILTDRVSVASATPANVLTPKDAVAPALLVGLFGLGALYLMRPVKVKRRKKS